MENDTVKMEIDDETGKDEEGGESEDNFLIKQEPSFNAECDFGQTSVWVDDIDSDEDSQPSANSNLGSEAQERSQQITSPVKKKVKVENEEREAETVPVSQLNCSGDCIHTKQNKFLKEVVHRLSKRNTLLEDFIQVEFGEKFQKITKERQHLLDKGYGKTGKLTNGKRSSKSDQIVEKLRKMKKSETHSKKAKKDLGGSHHHRHRSKRSGSTSSSQKTSQNEAHSKSSSSSELEILDEIPKKLKKSHKKKSSRRKPQPIFPQHKVTDIANDVANPLTDYSLQNSPPPPEATQNPPTPTNSTSINLREFLTHIESSDSEEEINGLTPPQLLKWQDLHKSRKLFICPVCNETLKVKNMRDHLMIIHKGIKLTCCRIEFKTRWLLKKHIIEDCWSETSYLAVMNGLEEPVIHWLNETCSEVVPTTMLETIRKKKFEEHLASEQKKKEKNTKRKRYGKK